MNNKLDIHNFWRSNIFIILIFAIISIVSSALLIGTHSVILFPSDDMYYHIQRIYELKDSILGGNWIPIIALNHFHQSGTDFMSLYPGLNIYPMALLALFINGFVKFFYISFTLQIFVGLLIAYFSSYFYNKNKRASLIFSAVYTLSSANLFHSIVSSDMGRSSSILLLPLAFFGFLELVRSNKWCELSIGMTAIILSHVINSVLVVFFLFILLLFNYKEFINKNKIISLLKAILVTTLLTGVFWVRFIFLISKNNINYPPNFDLDGTSVNDLIFNSFNNSISWTISTLGMIGLIFGILYYKKLNKVDVKLLWIGILFIIICSQVFPWHLINLTFVRVIQFTWRLYIIPQLIFCYILSKTVLNVFSSKGKNWCVVVILSSAMILELNNQQQLIDNAKNYNDINSYYDFLGYSDFKVKNNYEFNYFINGTRAISDYAPASTMSKIDVISNHQALYDGDRRLLVNLDGNGKYNFTNDNKIKRLSLPFMYYNGINYQVKLDGKTVKGYPNKNALMTINNVHKGKHHVQIIVHKTKAEIASYILSLIGLLILIGAILKNFLKKRKNK